jgi:CheY-like chemotaxis protein
VGEGTTVRLYFPLHVGPVDRTSVDAPTITHGDGEHILVVDDETSLTAMVSEALGRLGYVVEAHTSAIEALAQFRLNPEQYDLVLTDQIMPGMTGTRLAEHVRAARPDLPIILTTGYSATLTAERVHEMGLQRLLMKPVSLLSLGTAVHEVLLESKRHAPHQTASHRA